MACQQSHERGSDDRNFSVLGKADRFLLKMKERIKEPNNNHQLVNR